MSNKAMISEAELSINEAELSINEAELSINEAELPLDDLPIAAGLLKILLAKLEISVQSGELASACERVQKDLDATPPANRLRLILNELKIRGVQTALLSWRRFDRRRLPALFFHNGNWLVVERSNPGVLALTDTDGSCVECDEETLQDGAVLWLKKAAERQESSPFTLKGNIAARMVFKALFEHKRWVRDVVVATVVINVLAVATSIFAMQVYDRVVPTLAYATMWTLVVGMMVIVSIDWLLKTVRARILDSVACAVDKTVSQQVYDHVLHLQLDQQPRSLGTLAAQVGGLDSVRQFFSATIIFALVDMPFALLFIGFIGIIAGSVAWVYMLLLPVAAALGWITQRRLRRLLKEQMIRSNERQGLLVDTIRGAESIRASSASWRFSEEWSSITANISAYNIQQKAVSNLASVTTGSLSTAAYVSAIVVGVGQIEAGNLTMGGLIAASILGGRVIAPIAQSVQHLSQWQNVTQALDMVNQVLNINSERRPEQNLLMPESAPDHIELEQVTFSYPQSPIQQLNVPKLSFKAGDRVVLVGAIGSGKSTLLKILAGLYRPSEGRVRLGEADLWETDPNIVSTHVSYLPQSIHLFKGTLRSNLTLSGEVGDSSLLAVCRDLGIDQIAADDSLGMDLAISEGGEGLSGGQRQLVALGRVFLSGARVWLLDEPSSSLDAESEARVLQAIAAYVKPEDILVISTHRPMAAVNIATRMILMKHGEIVADGKPEQVMSQALKRGGQNPAQNNQRGVIPGAKKSGSIDVI